MMGVTYTNTRQHYHHHHHVKRACGSGVVGLCPHAVGQQGERKQAMQVLHMTTAAMNYARTKLQALM
jgi:hypothetical protein